jgi:hypothetical protein
MLRRRSRRRSERPDVLSAFVAVMALVEEAKATLLLGVPSGRSPRLPMAEALVGFEQGLLAARADMDRWLAPGLEEWWGACQEALAVSLDRAERLRLEAPSDAYEDLVPVLEGLLDPLDAFTEAAGALRRAGG